MFPFSHESFVKEFNRVFGNFDAIFRDAEKDLGKKGIFPTVTIPGILNAFTELLEQDETDESVTFYKNGKVHREDGPAVIYKNQGSDPSHKKNEYWLNGKQVTKEEVDALVAKKEEEKEHIVYLNGVEYKVKGKKALEELKSILKKN